MYQSFWGEIDKIYTNTRRPRRSKNLELINSVREFNSKQEKSNSKEKTKHKCKV